MYRSNPDETSGTGSLVTVRTYLDPLAAQLGRTNLEAHGIEAHVLEAASFNPILNAATGGTRIEVREGDFARAEAILRDRPGQGEADDGEGNDVVRCPRCELAYCFHERIRLEGNSAATALSFLAAPLLFFVPRRWHCHRCGHVWDNAQEGPRAMTKLAPDDPIPVFRLRRGHAGMGLFLGLIAGFLVQLVVLAAAPGQGGLELVFLLCFFGVPALGWQVGRSLRHDVCSEPGCRTRLPRDQEDCPRCRGAVAGVVFGIEEHYSAAADFRRELAALHARDRPAKKKKKKAGPGASARALG